MAGALAIVLLVVGGAVPTASASTEPPTVAMPFPAPGSVLVQPPAGTTQSKASRDCGFGIELSSGAELWIFCDTTNARWTGGELSLDYFVNSTAAVTFPNAPLVLRERWAGPLNPVPFIDPKKANGLCPANEERVIWPISGTAVPDGAGGDRVWVFYEDMCRTLNTLNYRSLDVGVAELALPAGTNLLAAPLQSTIRDGDLFPMGADPWRLWGTGAVWGRDGFVYIHKCGFGGIGCQAARVPDTQVANRAAYTFWTGSSWVGAEQVGATVAFRSNITPLGSHHVVWLPAMGLFGTGHAAGGAFADAMVFQLARRPEGPWSDGVIVPVSGCFEEIRCYTGAIHEQLSGIDHVALSIYDSSHPFADGVRGATRLVNVRVDLEPPVPGTCRSGFSDVWHASPFCREIRDLAAAGWSTGDPSKTFRPLDPMSRQAMAAWLWRRSGAPAPDGELFFTDVPSNHPFSSPIDWLAAAGLTTGYADGTYRPAAGVSRQAAVRILWRMAGAPPLPPGTALPPDVNTGDAWAPAVAWAITTGVTGNYADGTFRPAAPLSRQAMAAWMTRL